MEQDTKKCPYCGEVIKSTAKIQQKTENEGRMMKNL